MFLGTFTTKLNKKWQRFWKKTFFGHFLLGICLGTHIFGLPRFHSFINIFEKNFSTRCAQTGDILIWTKNKVWISGIFTGYPVEILIFFTIQNQLKTFSYNFFGKFFCVTCAQQELWALAEKVHFGRWGGWACRPLGVNTINF